MSGTLHWAGEPDAKGYTVDGGDFLWEPADVDHDDVILSTWPKGYSVSVTVEGIDLRVVAILLGIPLVDLSIEWDTHIIRGLE